MLNLSLEDHPLCGIAVDAPFPIPAFPGRRYFLAFVAFLLLVTIPRTCDVIFMSKENCGVKP